MCIEIVERRVIQKKGRRRRINPMSRVRGRVLALSQEMDKRMEGKEIGEEDGEKCGSEE